MTAAAVIKLDNEPIKCCVNVNNIAFGLLKQLYYFSVSSQYSIILLCVSLNFTIYMFPHGTVWLNIYVITV